MSSQRLRAKPDPSRAALAEARAHGLRQRQRARLGNARGRELTHRCRRCRDVIRLIDCVGHAETCDADEPP
ncbi:hypothetical protein [Labedaea rhizosphaerae]|uniref:Uncharacterized protein n=1 Tax=Labedaea rhizosphaerae TaxID=598644 RepID=A0A4R6SCN5_LABRH|nr:hypothetical protein [Labedaea rhizosphaerae]TDP97373.1 hypothetical protein EV186_103337 [Labedaea rhizosphaerae]